MNKVDVFDKCSMHIPHNILLSLSSYTTSLSFHPPLLSLSLTFLSPHFPLTPPPPHFPLTLLPPSALLPTPLSTHLLLSPHPPPTFSPCFNSIPAPSLFSSLFYTTIYFRTFYPCSSSMCVVFNVLCRLFTYLFY